MAVFQITRILHRRGTSGELPDKLEEGEIGMTTDTGEVFIGASSHPSVSGRKSYPYQNLKILTELDIQRSVTGDVYYHGPLVAGSVLYGQTSSIFPLFKHGERDFAIYDASIMSEDGMHRWVAQLNVAVHPSTPSFSAIKPTPGSVTTVGFESADYIPGGYYIDGDHRYFEYANPFTLSNLDSTGVDSGSTWLRFNNNLTFSGTGKTLIITISGREWTTPSTI